MNVRTEKLKVEQHTGYYPYGEPWREPSGQRWLYGGKERMGDNGLNEYDFSARRLNSALCLWTTPDPMAAEYGNMNPYVYCAGNPIKFVDPSGCILKITGDYSASAIMQLAQAVSGIELKLDNDGTVSYNLIENSTLNSYAERLIEVIDDTSITVDLQTQDNCLLPGNKFFPGGSFLGNKYDENTGNVYAKQAVDVTFMERLGLIMESPGANLVHEVTEAFEGGKIAQQIKSSVLNAEEDKRTYYEAHSRATPQIGELGYKIVEVATIPVLKPLYLHSIFIEIYAKEMDRQRFIRVIPRMLFIMNF